jgi:hypothetical protein
MHSKLPIQVELSFMDTPLLFDGDKVALTSRSLLDAPEEFLRQINPHTLVEAFNRLPDGHHLTGVMVAVGVRVAPLGGHWLTYCRHVFTHSGWLDPRRATSGSTWATTIGTGILLLSISNLRQSGQLPYVAAQLCCDVMDAMMGGNLQALMAQLMLTVLNNCMPVLPTRAKAVASRMLRHPAVRRAPLILAELVTLFIDNVQLRGVITALAADGYLTPYCIDHICEGIIRVPKEVRDLIDVSGHSLRTKLTGTAKDADCLVTVLIGLPDRRLPVSVKVSSTAAMGEVLFAFYLTTKLDLLSSSDAVGLRALLGSTPDLSNLDALGSNCVIFRELHDWHLETQDGRNLSIWTPLAAFYTLTSVVGRTPLLPALAVKINFETHTIFIPTGLHPPQRLTSVITLTRSVSRSSAASRALTAALLDVIARDSMQVTAARGCIRLIMDDYCDLFDLQMRHYVAVVRGAAAIVATWCTDGFLGRGTCRLPWTSPPIYVDRDIHSIWHLILLYPRSMGLRPFILRDVDVEFIEHFYAEVCMGLTGRPEPYWKPSGIPRAALIGEELYLPMLGWICAYLLIVRVCIPLYGPVVSLPPNFFETGLSRAHRSAFIAGFNHLLHWETLLATLSVAEVYSILALKEIDK